MEDNQIRFLVNSIVRQFIKCTKQQNEGTLPVLALVGIIPTFHIYSIALDQVIFQNTGVEDLVRHRYVDTAGTSGSFEASLKFPAITSISVAHEQTKYSYFHELIHTHIFQI